VLLAQGPDLRQVALSVFSALLSLTVVWPMKPTGAKAGAKAARSGDPAADRSGICSAAPCCTDVASRSAASTRIRVDAGKERGGRENGNESAGKLHGKLMEVKKKKSLSSHNTANWVSFDFNVAYSPR